MPRAENLLRMLPTVTSLKRLQMEEEQRRQEQEGEERFLSMLRKKNPAFEDIYHLTKRGVPVELAKEIVGYQTPGEQEAGTLKEMAGGLGQMRVQPEGAYTMGQIRKEAPPSISPLLQRLVGTFPELETGEPLPKLTPEESLKSLRIKAGLIARPGERQPTNIEYVRDLLKQYPNPSKTPNDVRSIIEDQGITATKEDTWTGIKPEKLEFRANQDEIDYIDAKAKSDSTYTQGSAEAWLRGRGYSEKDIDVIIGNTKFGIEEY